MSNICTCTNQGFWPQDGQQSKLNNNYTAVNEYAFGCSLAPEAVPEHNLGDYSRPEIPLYLHSSQIYECRDLFLTLQPLGVLQKKSTVIFYEKKIYLQSNEALQLCLFTLNTILLIKC